MTNNQIQQSSAKYLFNDLGLNDDLTDICKQLGYTLPTEIQQEAIPYAIKRKDIVGLAQTGSGKTLAFCLPILHNLCIDKLQFYALILAPTRELAIQITETLHLFTKQLKFSTCTIVGGVDSASQAISLAKRPHILIGTPGRICDHLENTKGFHLKNIKYLVLDEADKLLDLDFDNSLDRLLKLLNENRTTLLFSATMTSKVTKLLKISLKEPVKIQVSSKYSTVDTLVQYYTFLPLKYKECYLVNILKKNIGSSIICFVKSCEQTKKMTIILSKMGVKSTYINGKLKMAKRVETLSKFRETKSFVLVATDVASRGLDIPDVDLVINYDLPDSSKTYIHRVGRTARAGKTGKAINFVTQYDIEHIQRIEHVIGKKMEEYKVDRDECIILQDDIYEAKRTASIVINP